ncbi:glycosyltransferase family 4 protein [Emticicia sp. W12TSBA100-4]|uniref:glycosyltransferase family 4 protein n=1 Tax=Emticicia sp. W12TSBA100-4 TaxID=3160965 RepID=UPI003305C9E1
MYNNKKTLLIITECLPYPLNSGGNIAQFEMNDAVRGHFNIIIIFPLHKGQENDFYELKKLWDNVSFFPFYNNNKNKLHKLIYKKPLEWYYRLMRKFVLSQKNLSKIDSFILKNTKIFSSGFIDVEGEFVKHVNSIIEKNHVDIIQVEFYELVTLVTYLPKNIKKIFVNHELRYVREERELALLTTQIPYLKYLFIRNRGYEISFMHEYDRIITVSNDDCKELSSYLPPAKLYSSPLTIKLPTISQSDVTKTIKSIIFLGGEEHFPNHDGVQWFIENCWNEINQLYPFLNFSIVGKWSKESEKYYSKYKNIVFHGFVDDLGNILRDGVFIVPIRIGSGMRMKIVDAVNYQLPFVTTSIGVEGLLFKDKKDCLIADDVQSFIDSIVNLIKDANLRENLSRNAKETLFKEYSHEKLINKRIELYDSI